MNKSLLINGAWVALAATAFVVGRASVGPSGSNEDALRNGSKSNPTAGRSAPSSGPGSASRGRPGRSARSFGLDSASGRASGVTVGQFLSETDPLVANKMFADLLLDLDARNAPEIFKALRESGRQGNEYTQQMSLFLQAWGKLDGPSAMEALKDLGGDGRRRGYAGLAVMRGWASSDPEGAKAHLDTIENGWERGFYQYGLVSGLANADPTAATEFVIAMDQKERAREQETAAQGEEGQGRRPRSERERSYGFDRQMDVIANAQIARGIDVATSWVEGLPDGAIKSSAFDRVAEDFAKKDPEAAADWIKSHAQNDYAERAVGEVAEELSRKDPAGAVAWLAELPESSQTRAIHQSMERWTREDPVAAGEYLRAMPATPVRDRAIRSYAQEIDRTQPEAAIDWANSIGDEAIRLDTLGGVARSYLRSKPEEAKQWLPTSGLPEERQQAILRESERRREWGDRLRERGGRGR